MPCEVERLVLRVPPKGRTPESAFIWFIRGHDGKLIFRGLQINKAADKR
jgi:hypothetical protein